ncbi:MAG: hypothetical protein M1840_002483 [Geoglossum simile]|nr:MAG: hypothetical protein M1840_002483 [Geoglossum simile]
MYSLKVGTTTARHTIAGRAVYVRVTPRTRNINEGRQVLRELERFGPVEMFRSLKYDPETQSPNAALAIYQHTASARQLLDASPIRYHLNPSGGGEDKQVYSALAATWEEEGDLWKAAGITTREEPATEREAPETDPQTRFPPPTNPTLPYRSPWGSSSSSSSSTATSPGNPTFTLVASLSNLDHAAYISRQPYYGPYRPLADPVHSSPNIRRDERRSARMRCAPALGSIWKEGLSGNAEKGEGADSQRRVGGGLVRRVPE